ncbi:acetate/propionate family kinase [Pedobacter changchengzhani]|uniref:Acetate kinase n=1 Tax=Pedobacter changchengzhani TaxID=2529274 RepID=A0A4R5MLC5_9SPHI|nr:acetate/propionate family kinase [Pedobacter changchengzhani]TDG36481.1 acetate/propionate family kinase [Pedobacter changchengzhani]
MEKKQQIPVGNFILVINAGSSSLKFAVYQCQTIKREYSGLIKNIGKEFSSLKINDANSVAVSVKKAVYQNIDEAASGIISWLKTIQSKCFISSVGYRLVQGGPHHRSPEVITDELLEDLTKFIFLAPNHLPDELALIKKFRSAFPDLTHVACFDTNFHRDMPDQAKYYALPEKFKGQGLIRYGFHGLSYEYIMDKLDRNFAYINQKKIIIAHLGSGSSMAAVSFGKCIDTTMGVSPIGGLVMSTRSGDLDPGAILFMLKQSKMTVEELDNVLSHESGMKAIAGTGNMEELLKNASFDKRAEAAVNLFCCQAKKFIGALAAALGGLDILIFTGGVGENSPQIRERICADMDFMGVKLDRLRNQDTQKIISCQSSKVSIMVFETNEERMIALHTKKIGSHLAEDEMALNASVNP